MARLVKSNIMICEENEAKQASVEQYHRPCETSEILQRTRFVEYRNPYVTIAENAEGVFLEEAVRANRGKWHESTFGVSSQTPLDVEIGTGNGEFLAYFSATHPRRCMLGIERKFKPLIQTYKRLHRANLSNAGVLRYQADCLEDIFAPQEINDIYLFFPDPWPKTKHHKNRLVTDDFLKSTFALQRSNALFTVKTDDDAYFAWILEHARRSDYTIEAQTTDLHRSPWNDTNFMTQFERLWTEKGLKTKYLRMRK